MALQGTIQDFGLADIFQLIGIQRKSGVLTLENREDTVTIRFRDGQIVGADTRLRNLEDLLGSVLVRTGRVTEAQLRQALQTQHETLQRLGYVLVNSKLISEEDLAEALRIQVSQIVYRLFRWREGTYHFQAADNIEQEQFAPISSETVLMEGARMLDEWPIIERRIRSERMVLKLTEAGQEFSLPMESILDEDVELDFGFDGAQESGHEKSGEGEIKLSPEEREVLRIVDGSSTVQDIVDRSMLGEFDTYRILYELLTRNLLEEAPAAARTPAPERLTAGPRRLVGWLLMAALLGFSLVALASLSANPLTPWRLAAKGGTTDRLRTYASRVRLERIEGAIRIFYLDTGAVPGQLNLLARNSYLTSPELLDPWGRPYVYHLSVGGYQLLGLDSAGQATEELTVRRQFSASQRMMLDGSASHF